MRRNDEITVDDVAALAPARIVISPGPGRPEDGGRLGRGDPALRPTAMPMLGVCLGHQAIGLAFGGAVSARAAPMHGKTSTSSTTAGACSGPRAARFDAGRYHSLVVAADGLARRARATRPPSGDGASWGCATAVPGARRAVPSRVGADRRGPAPAAQLPGAADVRRPAREAPHATTLTTDEAAAAMAAIMGGDARRRRSPAC